MRLAGKARIGWEGCECSLSGEKDIGEADTALLFNHDHVDFYELAFLVLDEDLNLD